MSIWWVIPLAAAVIGAFNAMITRRPSSGTGLHEYEKEACYVDLVDVCIAAATRTGV
jgi:hypothetical protein